MKIICSKEILTENINIVSKAVSSKSTMPILGCILLTAGEDFKLMANDLEMAIETSPLDARIVETGSVALEAKIFFEIIRRMPESDIEIKTDSKNITTLRSGRTEFTIMGLNADEYPVIPEIEKNSVYTVKTGDLKDLIRQTIFAVSVDESKPVLTGELLEFKNNLVNIVAIDGFRVSYRKAEASFIEDTSAVIPAKTLNELSRILPDGDIAVNIYFTDRHVLFQLENSTIVSRLLDGEFIKYDQIFSDDCTTVVYADRSVLLSGIERATLISAKDGKKNPVKFRIGDDCIVITSNTEMGTSYDEIYSDIDGDPLDIQFNPKYLIDALRVIEEEKVHLQFTTSLSPCIMKGVGNDNHKYLILPLRMNG